MKKRSQTKLPEPDALALYTLLNQTGLESTFEKFLAVTEGPSNGRCLIPVCIRLHELFEKMPFWKDVDPFQGWDRLVDVVLDNRRELERASDHFCPKPPTGKTVKGPRSRNPMYGWIEQHPLYAMLCADQRMDARRLDYGSLRLQILHARWREARREADEKGLDPYQVLTDARDPSLRQVKESDSPAKKLRNLSDGAFEDLVKFLEPSQRPPFFRELLKSITEKVPLGEGYQSHFKVVFNYCCRDYRARKGGTHIPGERRHFQPSFTEFVDYGSWFRGVPLESEAGTPGQEAIFERSELEAEAVRHGLHPLESSGGKTVIRTAVMGAGTAKQATETARSGARSYEINRRLFPWSSDRMRLEEFQRRILPVLASSIPARDLEIAVLAAVVIETGRKVEDVLELMIDPHPDRVFAYARPRRPQRYGTWYWKPAEPEYRSRFEEPVDKSIPRATYLRYKASRLVTDLIETYCRRSRIRSGKLFRSEIDYARKLNDWIALHDTSETCTARKLAQLRWGILDELTGGELAHTCLLMGVPVHAASVEIHYAVLSFGEANELFRESSRKLWGVYDGSPDGEDPISASEGEKIMGARGFPKLSIVQDVVKELREASQAFFALKPNAFDPVADRDQLNRAVLYAVWHQFYMFATRAIRDSYQDLKGFARSGIGLLSDKDFEDHHKTRMIWADERLLKHMAAIEGKLAKIRERMKDAKFPEDSPLWLLSPENRILGITPSDIEDQLQAVFPFEANVHRKVMRNLLRAPRLAEVVDPGLTHEQAEAYMGHWWGGREPWSPFSSFDWQVYLKRLKELVPPILLNLGFTWVPGEERI